MKNGLFVLSALSVILFACERSDTRTERTTSTYDTDRNRNLGDDVRTYRYDSDAARANRFADDSRIYRFSDESRNFRYDADNTGRNFRDRDFSTATSGDQSESSDDILITKKIRRILIDRGGQLSTNAKNVKIITIDGYVTLRGMVNNPQEKNLIEREAKSIQGVKDVDNQLDISSTNNRQF